MIYHIVTGDLAAVPLKDAIKSEPAMSGEVVVMKDVLSLGPLEKAEGEKFSEVRGNFWHMVLNGEKTVPMVDDLERLLLTGNELSKNEEAKIWLWVAPLPADMCTYLWAQLYLRKYPGRIYVVNIEGLPFLDEKGKIFYPKSLAEILPAELKKARKLARPITPSETEADIEDWMRLKQENTCIRVLENGKKLYSKNEDFYDDKLVSFCSHQFQKAQRIIGQAISKFNIPTGDVFLGWRLKKLADSGKLQMQGDITKTIKDYEIKLPGAMNR